MASTGGLVISDEEILDACRVVKAVGEQKKKESANSLLEEDTAIEMTITYLVDGKRKNTPCVIHLPHSLFSVEDGDNAILIVRDNDIVTKAILKEYPIKGLEKVITISKLRKTFERYKQKRDIVKSFTRFLCDERVISMVPSILGKAISASKKQPIPISMNSKPEILTRRINKALSSTSLFVNWGSVSNIKVGKVSFTEEQLLENIRSVLEAVQKYVKPHSIQRLCVKVEIGESGYV